MKVHEISYAGGLDWMPILQTLAQQTQAEGFGLLDEVTLEQAERIFEQIVPGVKQWLDERKPYLHQKSLDIGEYDVTPEEMVDEGKWKYTLTVGQDQAKLRRQYIKPIEQPVQTPEAEVAEPTTTLGRWAARIRQKFIDAFVPQFPTINREELMVELLGGNDVTWTLEDKDDMAILPDPSLLFFGGYKRMYTLLTVDQDHDRHTSKHPLPRRRIPVPTA